MPRRHALSLLLVFFLLLSQQLGMSHAISHLASEQNSSLSGDKQLPAEMQCDQCAAFASIASGLATPQHVVFADRSASDVFAFALDESFLPHTACPFDSRAPPA